MSPEPAIGQRVNETYGLLRRAAASRQPVEAMYDGQPRLLCPHVLGRKSGRLHVLFYQFGGRSNSGLTVAPEGVGNWRCFAVEKTHPGRVECRGVAHSTTRPAADLH